MRHIRIGILIVLLLASTAPAAVVTYTLSLNDNGAGVPTLNNFAVYVSASSDNGGLFGFGVDLTGATFATIANRAPGVIIENPDTGERKEMGFTTGRTQDALNGKVSGLQNLAAGVDLVPVYGFGQEPGALPPPGYGIYSDTVATFGIGRTPYAADLLVARGTFTAGCPTFEATSVDNKASVFVTRSGIANTVATLAYSTRSLIADGGLCGGGFGATATLNGTPLHTNQAVNGFIAVSGANNKYVSEVDPLLEPSVNVGSAPIATIGDEAGNVYVMAKLAGTANDINTLLGQLTTDVDASDSQFALLHSNYDALFGLGGFNALFKFPNSTGAKVFNWDFSPSAVTVDQLAAVPEPGMALAVILLAAASIRRPGQGRGWF